MYLRHSVPGDRVRSNRCVDPEGSEPVESIVEEFLFEEEISEQKTTQVHQQVQYLKFPT